ncbi:hypothetical protein [Halalkalibacterium ligniniphilum]|nr:hypothetical protein [Halalkalibacterium ligniniphilum]
MEDGQTAPAHTSDGPSWKRFAILADVLQDTEMISYDMMRKE